MKKVLAYTLFSLLAIGCQKHGDDDIVHYEEAFQVHFKFDGKEYSKVLRKNVINAYTGISFQDGRNLTQTLGPLFELDSNREISFQLGYFRWIADDTTANYQTLHQLLRTGNREYKCLACMDTTVRDGVEITFAENQSVSWSSNRTDANFKPVPITTEQTGSSFVITDVKESTNNGINNNAFIIKGTFSCNLYQQLTGEKKALTDGTFTCLLSAF